ncbi:DUF3089 domain-containing protein [Sphingosinicella soli]|uniref:DUF3089 domain-containing protein n=1 Tax=Sphingosinicella soli TaxID=333708 RepID=A0A7W7AYB8_9SPHN|nr:DUF3089 domain-containing protein [Sphingosinicella soli]MBB4630625.1 hypothetical protein [Sphingosinicella soli]
MAARRFLYIIAALIVLAIAGAFAYRIFAPHLMRAAFVPSVSFADSPKPVATFYNRADAWLARPGIPADVVRWTPEGYSPAPKPAVAVFYVHPTTYLKADRWNAPIALTGDPRFRQTVFLKSQASVFNGIGEVWAPKYRQATFGAFLALGEPDSAKSFALAYSDIENAFELFLREIPADRKIILAGHSQGSLHLVSLLAQKIAGTPVADRIVAAYLIGWPISIETDLPKLGLKPCETPEETGCIIAFQSYAEPAQPESIFDPFYTTIGLTGAPRAGTHLLCINPLTGGPDLPAAAEQETAEAPAAAEDIARSSLAAQAAPLPVETMEGAEESDPYGPARNLGTLIPVDETYSAATLEAGTVGAQCTDRGYLSIGEKPPEGLRSYVLPGNNYHVYDYALFWTNLRTDAERRAQAALTSRAQAVRAR